MQGSINRSALRHCIQSQPCWRTQKTFAKACGIRESHLSEFLSGKAGLSPELRRMILLNLEKEIEEPHAIVIREWPRIKQAQVNRLLESSEFMADVRAGRRLSEVQKRFQFQFYTPSIDEAYKKVVEPSRGASASTATGGTPDERAEKDTICVSLEYSRPDPNSPNQSSPNRTREVRPHV